MKKDYHQVKELRELSGFGWDSENNMVTAHPESVWTDYAKVRRHRLPLSIRTLEPLHFRSILLYFNRAHQYYPGTSVKGSPCPALEGEAISSVRSPWRAD